MRVVPLLTLCTLLTTVTMADASGVAPSQVVIHQSDVPNNVLVKSQTHPTPGYGSCSSAYQSEFGSGLGGSQAIYSAAYECPSATIVANSFAPFSSYYRQYYNRRGWHQSMLSNVKAGHQHLAWNNQDVPGGTSSSGARLKTNMVTLVFQRDNYLAFLQITYLGESRAVAEGSASRLGYLMDHRILHDGH